MRRAWAVVAGLLGAACAASGGDAGWSVETSDSAGVVRVANRGPAAGAGPVWSAVEELAVGGDEALPETLFGNVADVAVDDEGRLYVLDPFAQHVVVLGAEGNTERIIGGPGEGPGELSRLAASLVVRRDTLLVGDWARRGVHRFLTDGTFVDLRPFPAVPGARTWWRAGAGGALFFRSLERYVTDEGAWAGRDLLLRVGSDWSRPDTMLALSYEETDLGGPEEVRAAILVNAPMWAALPDGRIARATLYGERLWLHDASGALERIVSHDAWRRRPPTLGEQEALRERLEEKLVMMGGRRGALDAVPVDQPELLPALTSLVAGEDGTIWVQRMGPVTDVHPMALNTPDPPVGWGGGTWDVLDARGRYLATVELPRRFRLMRVRGDLVYGVRRDELDVETVVRIRITRGGA